MPKRKPVTEANPFTQAATPQTAKPGRKPTSGEKKVSYAYSLLPSLTERVAAVAYWERVPASAVVERAIEEYIDRLEKKRGEAYPPKPEKSGL